MNCSKFPPPKGSSQITSSIHIPRWTSSEDLKLNISKLKFRFPPPLFTLIFQIYSHGHPSAMVPINDNGLLEVTLTETLEASLTPQVLSHLTFNTLSHLCFI